MKRSAALALVLLGLVPAASGGTPAGVSPWQELAPGLELGRFGTVPAETGGAITILRIDPARQKLVFRGVGDAEEKAATARGWCEREGLTAAINAGMFDVDFRTHIGYLREGTDASHGRRNRYLSAAAFGALRGGPEFRLFDLDVTPLDQFDGGYRTVIQNLRVVKRPGVPVWVSEGRRWSEAALGEDGVGRALFVFSRRPVAMAEFAARLLALPIGLVALQHLEGGAQAQLYVKATPAPIELTGISGEGPETGDSGGVAWPIPNVIGVAARH